jgi:putative sterol carrier protein
MDAETWLALANGETNWAAAMATGKINASGARADLTDYLPLQTTNRQTTNSQTTNRMHS